MFLHLEQRDAVGEELDIVLGLLPREAGADELLSGAAVFIVLTTFKKGTAYLLLLATVFVALLVESLLRELSRLLLLRGAVDVARVLVLVVSTFVAHLDMNQDTSSSYHFNYFLYY